ncbi:MAG: hypothetical protein COT81_05210 [Candidatus Buchananbacteria bacterium CG10_big_fil_rev_8_21_14_0_10_42_9]|uniref:ABC transporter domain-containing protein n=1 Tax=Candidatus Buchananbacteria bacterium CG10_big_fil_rev_8_21_14_0_10_42_9 TaxID=1974526 RepID=A0A2H0W027_9BACT|nr:MAG: hypothetical protein COT81_05210 [Candidatus Buchananbacteria bacterium CG10_big_fil_rev_8_21_14_0_10_42_9]
MGVEKTPSQDYQGQKYYFCGDFCLDRFVKNPDKYFGLPLIKFIGLKKSFQLGKVETKVLRGINLNIWAGDFVAIVGASGSGKSTCLNMIGLLDRPTSGSYELEGENVANLNDIKRANLRAHTFGFVFQQYNLIPWFTALENVTLPLTFANQKIDEAGIKKSFEDIGLGERMHHRPLEMSGGEQQRVALLRSLANDPKIILGDEPTGNLDSVTGDKILQMLIKLNKEQGKTLIVVTHDADIAEKADQIVVLKDGLIIPDHHSQKKIYTD